MEGGWLNFVVDTRHVHDNHGSAMTTNSVDYGKAIRVARAARDMTQRELAIASGTTPGYISYLETNSKRPSAEMIEALGKALNIPVWVLVMLGSSDEDLGPVVAPLALPILHHITKTPGQPPRSIEEPPNP